MMYITFPTLTFKFTTPVTGVKALGWSQYSHIVKGL